MWAVGRKGSAIDVPSPSDRAALSSPSMVTRAVRRDVVIRELAPAPPPRPISVILPSGYRSPAAPAMLQVLRDVGQAWVSGRPALAERTGAVSV